MSDNLMEKVSAFGERLKIGGAEVGRKMSAGMSSMSFKVKELLQGPNQEDKLVEDATAETLDEPNWAMNLEICDMINHKKVSSVELIPLLLLETCAKNCEKAFSEVAPERVLDEIVKLTDDPQTVVNNRNKALMLIEAWGESTSELRYLPVYEETYKSLKSRGIRFPGRDNDSLVPIFTPPRSVSAPEVDASLTHQIQYDIPLQSFTAEQIKEAFDVARNSIELLTTVLSSSPHQDALQSSTMDCERIIKTAGDNDALLFEGLKVNDEIQKVLSKYEELKTPSVVPAVPEPALIPVAVEPDSPIHAKEDALIRKPAGQQGGTPGGSNDDLMDDLDEMIFGEKGGSASEGAQDPKKDQLSKDDLITF
ncbi:TOM1 protein [Salix suchowensis]|nr:TOM1 protein [Salix suchowensis]